MEPTFVFAKRINDIGFIDTILNGIAQQQRKLSIISGYLNTCNPSVGLYKNCIRHHYSGRFSIVAEYLYHSLLYRSTIPTTDDPIKTETILLNVRNLKAKYKSTASCVDRLCSIFHHPKFSVTLKLEPTKQIIYSAAIYSVETIHIHVTMRFNYLNRVITRLHTDHNTMIKILMYSLLLR